MDPLREANKMFLLSLLPDLNEMSSHQRRMFKRKVMDLIDDILHNTPKILSPNSNISTGSEVSAEFQPTTSTIQTEQGNILTPLNIATHNPQRASSYYEFVGNMFNTNDT